MTTITWWCSPFSRTGNRKIKQDFIYKATNVQRLRASETAEIDANVCFFIISVLSVYIQAQVLQWWAPVLERQCCWKTREEGRAERQECWDMVERRTTAICCVSETKARSGATDVDSSWYRWEWSEAVVMLKKEYVSSVDGYEESVKLKADRKETVFYRRSVQSAAWSYWLRLMCWEQLNETESTIHTLLHGDNTGGTAG